MVRRTEEQDYFFDCKGALGLTATDRGKKQTTKIQKNENDALKPKGMNDKTKVEALMSEWHAMQARETNCF